MKKLPDIFKPIIDKNINNNEDVFYSFSKDDRNSEVSKYFSKSDTVTSNSHDIVVKTKNNIYKTKVLNRVGNNILLDNGRILNIVDVLSIEDV